MVSPEAISREELDRMLYSACDILRGPINQDEYKAYLTPLLFFKRLSDVYDEETEDALEESGGDAEYAALPDNHSFAIPDGCHWRDVREKTKDVGKAIIDAMMGIERANPETLGGLFSSFDETDWANKNILDDERLSYGRVFGQENNLSTSAIARMNLFLHGARDFRIAQGDTLRDPQLVKGEKLMTFDCVLANPPFSLKHWGAEQFESDKYGRNLWGTPTEKGGADWAWLQHMVCSMDARNGRCAVILPQGVLFHGNREAKMREGLVKADILECVITLASGVFYSTGVSACILFLNNRKPAAHKGKVCLIDGSKVFTAKRAQNYISDSNAEELVGYYEAYEDVVERCSIASIEQIAGQGYSLQVSNFIEQTKMEIEPPEAVMSGFMDLLDKTDKDEFRVRGQLAKGGYLDAE